RSSVRCPARGATSRGGSRRSVRSFASRRSVVSRHRWWSGPAWRRGFRSRRADRCCGGASPRANVAALVKHWITYPLVKHPYNPEFMSGDGLARVARAAEAAGFDGIGFTDHPAPSDKWLTSGGHDALDPFAALPYVAAVTERIRLIPNIVVLPYRNPFLV